MRQENLPRLKELAAHFSGKKGSLIPFMQEVQRVEGYLSREAIEFIAKESGIPSAEVYGVATFYTMFRLKPQGKNIVRVCKGTACHVANATAIVDALRTELKLGDNDDTTDDGQFTLMEVACLGCCSLAPVVMINATAHGKLQSKNIPDLINKYRK